MMNIRRMLLSGALLAGLTLALAPRAAADPSPWSGMWDHSRRTDEDRSPRNQSYWEHRNGDRDYIRKGWQDRDDRSDRGEDPRYTKLVARIHHDRAKIAEIAPTGRNRKALQWFRKDLRDAESDLRDYRDLRTSGERYDEHYDSRRDDDAQDFDWPGLLGSWMNPTQ